MDSIIYIFLANGFEEMEALVPLDILRRANFTVETISITDEKEVIGSHNLHVICDNIIDNITIDNAELLILPGGMPGSKNLAACTKLAQFLTQQNQNNKRIAAICAAPFILGELHILEDKEATCYPGYEQHLLGAKIINKPVVVSQNIITGNGAGAAIKFAFAIIKEIKGSKIANLIAGKMQLEL